MMLDPFGRALIIVKFSIDYVCAVYKFYAIACLDVRIGIGGFQKLLEFWRHCAACSVCLTAMDVLP